MPAAVEPIDDDEIILRRIPPSNTAAGMVSLVERPEGGWRASSARLSTAPGEVGLSCTRLRQTSPRSLLEQLRLDDIDPSGWFVCRLRVREVRRLDLEVIHVPTERDPGHCEIRGAGGTLAYPNNLSQKLARRTRVLTDEEMATWNAGDCPED